MKKTFIFSALFLLVVITARAQAPQLFNYQGVARSVTGSPVAGSPIGLQLTIRDVSPTGSIVYQETQTANTNPFGLFTVSVGGGTVTSGNFSTINWGSGPKYMEVDIDPLGGTSYSPAGTSQLLSVPYAVYANTTGSIVMSGDVTGATSATTVVKLQGNPVSAAVPVSGQVLEWNSGNWTPTTVAFPTVSGTTNYVSKFTGPSSLGNSLIYDNGTSIGLGTTSPAATNTLEVVQAGSGTNNHAVHGTAGGVPSGTITPVSGVYGESNTGIGISGVSNSNDGVFGYSTSASSGGVSGYNSTAGGAGIIGTVAGSGGTGGFFDGGTGGYGVIVTNGNSGFGTTSPGATLHVSGSSDETVTIDGQAFDHQAAILQTGTTATTNVGTGAVGVADNSSYENHGLFGLAAGNGASFDVGVFGLGEPTSSTTGNSYGVVGNAVNGANNYGVYGENSTTSGTSYAGYFSGAVHITGTISKGGGSFKIDHPLDPENKYLYHSFVESPDMMNIYNGNITTDANGDAEVTLPDYFEALNKDFRYQLTVIGTFAQAIINKKVNGNKFSIKTSVPNVEVSWQVTGVRQDKFANAHRIIPEVEKEQEFKGRYLHAAEWGMPDSKSIDALTRPHTGVANNSKSPNGLNTPAKTDKINTSYKPQAENVNPGKN